MSLHSSVPISLLSFVSFHINTSKHPSASFKPRHVPKWPLPSGSLSSSIEIATLGERFGQCYYGWHRLPPRKWRSSWTGPPTLWSVKQSGDEVVCLTRLHFLRLVLQSYEYSQCNPRQRSRPQRHPPWRVHLRLASKACHIFLSLSDKRHKRYDLFNSCARVFCAFGRATIPFGSRSLSQSIAQRP